MRCSRVSPVVVGMVCTVALAGCGGGGDSHGSSSGNAAGAETAQAPDPISEADYTTLLASVAADLTGAIDQLRAATPQSLTDELTTARDRIRAAKNRVTEVVPPPGLKAGHTTVIAGLSDLTNQLKNSAADYTAGRICTPSAVADSWGDLPSIEKLRIATDELGPAGASLAAVLPPPGPLDRRLETGTLIKDPGDDPGELIIDNQTDTDSAVTIARGQQAVGTIYVTKHTTATMRGIPAGEFDVFIASGTDWDPTAAGFSRSCTFTEFVPNDHVPFRYGLPPQNWSGYTISLHTVDDGNATTPIVDRDRFPR